MPHDISAVQQRLLKHLTDRGGGPVSTPDLGRIRDGAGELGTETARRAMGRLKARGYAVDHDSRYRRSWSITDAGVEALEAFTGVPGDWTRKYVLLQRVSLEDVLGRADLVLWCDRGEVAARNTAHAYAQAAERIPEDGRVEVAAVPQRNFRPEPIHLGTKRTVTIG